MTSVQPDRQENMTGGEAVVHSLLKNNVDVLFCLPGVQNDWLFNALYDHGQSIRIIHTRHEQGAAYMALGYALATGKPAVCSVVPGPGLLNASAALATAYSLNAPVLCLCGQIPTKAIGKGLGALHEIPHQLEILQSMTKWVARANAPDVIPGLIDEAFARLGSERPRPVGIEIPMDVLAASALTHVTAQLSAPESPVADKDKLDDAAAALAASERPMIFVGSGAQDASSEVRALAKKLNAPVVGYRTGKGVMDGRDTLAFHLPEARRYWPKCDLGIAIGSNARETRKWAVEHRPRWLRIDVDSKTHQSLESSDVAVTGRAEDVIPELMTRLAGHEAVNRDAEFDAIHQQWSRDVGVLQPQIDYLEAIRAGIGEQGILVDELTQVGFASRIAWHAWHPRTYISTGYQGTLGYGFPTSLGVKVARPDVPVVSITGDGGFMFAVQELATAVQHKIGVVVIVFNNNQYGNVQQMQKNDYGGRVIASDLHNPDFHDLAVNFGARAVRADNPAGVEQAIREASGHDLPTLIDVSVGEMPSVDRFR